ncbi:MAG: TspO/MBR family protein [Sphingobium sp.]
MSEIASKGQLRWSFARWALLCVPLVLLLGIASGQLANSGYGNPWFDALVKPAIMPPGWAFGAAWTILYVLMGLALAMILNARGAAGRSLAIALFVAQFLLNLAWSPIFFAAHQVGTALLVILAMLVLAVATTVAFRRVRPAAAALLLPYLAWLCFAATLNYQIGALNPDAATLAPSTPKAQIDL